MDMERVKIIANLRKVADWFEDHPKAVIPYSLRGGLFMARLSDEPTERAEELRALGSFTKVFDNDGDFRATVMIGPIKLQWYTQRENVCTKRVVGTKIVPERYVEGTASYVEPEHEEEIVEWDCSSVLAPEEKVS